jgi:hypothetical protein
MLPLVARSTSYVDLIVLPPPPRWLVSRARVLSSRKPGFPLPVTSRSSGAGHLVAILIRFSSFDRSLGHRFPAVLMEVVVFAAPGGDRTGAFPVAQQPELFARRSREFRRPPAAVRSKDKRSAPVSCSTRRSEAGGNGPGAPADRRRDPKRRAGRRRAASAGFGRRSGLAQWEGARPADGRTCGARAERATADRPA